MSRWPPSRSFRHPWMGLDDSDQACNPVINPKGIRMKYQEKVEVMVNIQKDRAARHARARTQNQGRTPTAGTRPAPGLLAAAHRVAIISSGVLAGAILATWLNEASLDRSAELWIEYHQAITSAYTRALPPLGGLALLAALATLAMMWRIARTRWFVLAVVGCLVVGFLATVVVHFPINAEILTWQPAAPPADWQGLRDRWLTAHLARSVAAFAGFALLVLATPGRQRTSAPESVLK